MSNIKIEWTLAAILLVATATTWAQNNTQTSSCKDCPEWNREQKPFKVYGNTYYVGPHAGRRLRSICDDPPGSGWRPGNVHGVCVEIDPAPRRYSKTRPEEVRVGEHKA